VLVRRRVEHEVGSVVGEHVLDTEALVTSPIRRNDTHFGVRARDLEVDEVQRRLARSNRMRRAGRNAASCRAISDPMDPAAPVMRIVRPVTSRATAARSSDTGCRPNSPRCAPHAAGRRASGRPASPRATGESCTLRLSPHIDRRVRASAPWSRAEP
jgi:hypothetical protein